MNNIQKRFVLFLFGCITTRLLFAFVSKYIPITYLPWLGAIALIPMFGWLYIYFIGKRNTGAEVFGDKIWWNNLRIIHALLYGIFAFYAFNKKRVAWIALLTDVIIGLISFLLYHYTSGNFAKLVQ